LNHVVHHPLNEDWKQPDSVLAQIVRALHIFPQPPCMLTSLNPQLQGDFYRQECRRKMPHIAHRTFMLQLEFSQQTPGIET
jgi:hypothetical protein